MNKTELVEQIAAEADLTKADSNRAVDATMQAIQDALTDGDKVTLVGFGTFSVRERAARMGVNPQTKEKMKIPAMKSVHFKAGKTLKEAVRNS